MSKLNVNKIGVTIISRAGEDMTLMRRNLKINDRYENEYEKRDLLREELRKLGIEQEEHLCFNCQNADYENCPKVRDTIKKLLLDDEAYDFIEMAIQVYENKISNNQVDDEVVLFNVQKCKNYKG